MLKASGHSSNLNAQAAPRPFELVALRLRPGIRSFKDVLGDPNRQPGVRTCALEGKGFLEMG